ncbi:MAG: hypothetical protein IT376_06095 [Polyangiaceae bacterium]|nr:hypothetical protein [Polyangiaceae bacterium]
MLGSSLAESRLPGVRVVAIAQARMGSSRLPGKVLKRAGTASILAHLVRRLQRARTLDAVVVATTDRAADDPLEAVTASLGVALHRGPEHDVLRRYADAARAASAAVIVRVTGDCPLLDPHEVDRVVEAFLERRGTPGEVDYATNQAGADRRIPRGYDVEVVSRAALERADREATAPGDREHVLPWISRGEGGLRALVTHPEGVDGGGFRVTVDTAADLTLVRAVVAALGEDAGLSEVVEFLSAHPEVAALNAGVAQKSTASEEDQRRAWIAGRVLVGRGDAGPAIGVGHVTRLEGVLGAWTARGGRAVLRCRGVQGALAERLAASGIELDPAASCGSPEDLTETLALARRERAVAIAVDGYAFDDTFLARLRAEAPLLVFADDAETLSRGRGDLVLALGAGAGQPAPAGARLLAGPSYAPLRGGVLARLETAASAGAARVVVSLGGADPARMTGPIVARLLERLPATIRVVAVLGGASGLAPAELAGAPLERLELVRDAPELAALLAGATLAVLAAGSTTWEAMALGVPAVLLEVAPNQRGVVEVATSLGAAVSAGTADADAPGRVAQAAVHLLGDATARLALAAAGRRAVDGRGPVRILDALGELVAARGGGRSSPDPSPC